MDEENKNSLETENTEVVENVETTFDTPSTENETTNVEENKIVSDEPSNIPPPSFEVNSEGEIVIDNTKTEPIEVPVTLDRTTKLKEPISKQKKIAIMCIAAAVVVVLFCSIFFPCFFYFRGKVMVSSASDFSEGENGKYFVLRKNVVVDGDLNISNLDSSIDLNGHDLTVNGKLTLSTEAANAINIGTKDGDQYKPKGILTVDDLEINAPNANINLASTVVIKGKLDVINAKEFTVAGVSIVNSSTIVAQKITIKEAIAAANNEITCTFKSPKVDIYGLINVENSIFEQSDAVVYKSATMKNITLDAASNLQVFGKVNKISGGNKVALLDNATCESFNDVKLLAIYKAHNKTFKTTNCSKTIYLDKLETPVDLIVSEEGGKFKATSAVVTTKGAPVNYQFTYIASNGKETLSNVSSENFYDITSLLKSENGASNIVLKVQAKGDYNFNQLNYDYLVDGACLYLDSDYKKIEYTYSLTLATPSGLNVTKIDDEVVLTFNSVEFADYYNVIIDNKHVVKSDTNRLVLNDYVADLGYHSIRVTANSNSKELLKSKEAMTSYKTVKKLAAPTTVKATCKEISGKFIVSINFEAIDGVYLVSVADKTYRIANQTSLEISSDVDLVGQNVTVKVEGYDFFEDSDIATIQIESK